MTERQPPGSYKKLNIEQVSQRVYEEVWDALRVRLVEPIAATITDDITISGEVNAVSVPPSDRRFLTLTVTAAAQALTFPNFDIKGINVKSSQDSSGRIRIGESSLVTGSEYTVLEPGEAYGAEVNGTLNPIYVAFDTGTTSATVHIVVLGDPS